MKAKEDYQHGVKKEQFAFLIYLTTKYMAPLCCAINSVSIASTFGAAIWRITMNKS